MEFSARRLFIETITDDSGIVIPAVTVTVYDAGTTGTIPLYYAKSGLSFTGTGNDDLSVQTPFAGSSDTQFRLKMMTGGTKFKWSDDGGTTWDETGITITGAHLITGALVVHFTGTTGHDAGDRWDLYARPNPFVTDSDGVADAFGNGDVYDEITIVLSKTDYSFTDINAALEYLPVRGIRGHTGTTGATGADSTVPGPTGPTGASGSFGGDSFAFIFCTGTSDAFHGTGSITLNSTGLGSTTILYVDDMEANEVDIQPWLRALTGSTNTIKGSLRLFEEFTPSNFAIYDLTGAEEAATYFKLKVAKVAVNGSFLSGDSVVMSWTRAGDLGHTGPTGAAITGPTGARGKTGVTGAMTATGGILTISPTGAEARDVGQIRFLELAANGTHYAALRAADSLAATYYLTLPTGDGSTGQALIVDADGDLHFGSVAAEGVTGVTDGDKGDIVVSAGGATWTIQTGAVNLFKLETGPANSVLIATGTPKYLYLTGATVLGRTGAGGNLTGLTGGQIRSLIGLTITGCTGITDGDKGDIVVSAGGATWTIETGAVNLFKLETGAANTVLVNATTGAHSPTYLAMAASTVLGRGASGNLAALTGAQAVAAMGITASKTELNYTDGVTSAIQTQVDARATVTTASVTLYVATTGNDSNAGTAGSPKLTISGAMNALPGVIAHDCYINVAPGTYTETLNTAMSRLNIVASLTIRAVDTADKVWHVRGTASAATATTLTIEAADIDLDNDWNGAYVMIYDGTGQGQIIAITDSDDSDATITVADWDATADPAANSKYVLTGKVVIDGNAAAPLDVSGRRNFVFEGIRFTMSGSDAYNCVDIDAFSFFTFTDCLFDDKYALSVGLYSAAYLYYCGALTVASGYAITAQSAGFIIAKGCCVYGAKSSDYGLYAASNGTIQMDASEDMSILKVANGAKAVSGGMILGSVTVYTDVTTAASPNALTSSEHADAVMTDQFAYVQDQS